MKTKLLLAMLLISLSFSYCIALSGTDEEFTEEMQAFQDSRYQEDSGFEQLNDKDKAFLIAVHSNDIKAVQAALLNGANINVTHKFRYVKYTALSVAAIKDNYDVVKLLVEANADVNIHDWYSDPLTCAVRKKRNPNGAIITKLLEGKPNNEQLNLALARLLQEKGKSLEIVTLLIKAGADVNGQDNWGNNLFSTLRDPKKEIIETLILSGADINPNHAIAETALCAAKMYANKSEEILRSIVGQSVIKFIDQISQATKFPAPIAKIITLYNFAFLEKNYKKLIRDAVRDGDKEALGALIAQDKNNVNIIVSDSDYLMFEAVANSSTEIVKLLLENGVNPNGSEGYEKAVFLLRGHEKEIINKVKLLLSFGADFNVETNDGDTPINNIGRYLPDFRRPELKRRVIKLISEHEQLAANIVASTSGLSDEICRTIAQYVYDQQKELAKLPQESSDDSCLSISFE